MMEEFMTEKLVYECENCGKSLEVSAGEAKAPQCCDKPMRRFEPLDACHGQHNGGAFTTR